MLNFYDKIKAFVEDVAFVKRTWIVKSEDGTKARSYRTSQTNPSFDAGRVKNKRNKDTREFSKYVTPQLQLSETNRSL